jgi:signal peptidase I
MSKQESKTYLKCWSQRLWWAGFLTGLVSAYFILRNFTMNFVTFAICLGAILTVFTAIGNGLGVFIDRRFRTARGVLNQEKHIDRHFLHFLEKTLSKHKDEIDTEIFRKFENAIQRFSGMMNKEETNFGDLFEERGRLEQMAKEHLVQFKKSPLRDSIEQIGLAVLIALFIRAFMIEPFQIPSGSMIPSLRYGDHLFVNKLSYGIRIPLLPATIFDKKIPAVSWNWARPEKGDVIVFITPKNDTEDYIKRVVAVEGDTIHVHDGQVFVNDVPYPLKDEGSFEYNDLDEAGNFRGKASMRLLTETIGEMQHPILRKSCTTKMDCWRFNTECDPKTQLCGQDSGPFACREPFQVPKGYVFVMGDNRDNSEDGRYWGPVPLEYIKGKAKFIWWSYREGQVQWDRMFSKIR